MMNVVSEDVEAQKRGCVIVMTADETAMVSYVRECCRAVKFVAQL
jgi:hypothetical protein